MANKNTDQVAVEPEVKAPEAPKVSFEDFQKVSTFHPGIMAAFRWEAGKVEGGLDDRTSEEWILALEEQAKRNY